MRGSRAAWRSRWPELEFLGMRRDGEVLFLQEHFNVTVVHTADWSAQAARDLPAGSRLWRAFNCDPGSTLVCRSTAEGCVIGDWQSDESIGVFKTLEPGIFPRWCGEQVLLGLASGQLQVCNPRFGTSLTLAGHDSTPMVNSMTEDKTLMFTAALDGTGFLWHAASGQQLVRAHSFNGGSLRAQDRSFSYEENGTHLGRIQSPSCVRLLPETLIQLDGADCTESWDLSPDGRWLVLHNRREIAVREVSTGRLLAFLSVPDLKFARFSARGDALLLGTSRVFIACRFTRQGSKLQIERDPEQAVPDGSLALMWRLSEDRTRLVAATNQGYFEMPLPAHEAWRKAGIEKDALPLSLAWSGNARWLVEQSARSPLRVRCLDDAREPFILRPTFTGGRSSFSPDNRWLACTGQDFRTTVFDTQTWQPAREFVSSSNAATRLMIRVPVCQWDPPGRWFTRVEGGRTIQLVEAGTWRVLAELRGPLDLPFAGAKITPDGATMLVMRSGGVIEVWDLRALATELRGLGMPLELPPPLPSPASPAGLDGPFDEVPLPPLKMK